MMLNNDKFWSYIFRVVDYIREGVGEDFIDRCLEGRERNAENLGQLWKVAGFFSADSRKTIRDAVEQSADVSGKPILSRAALNGLEPPAQEQSAAVKRLLRDLDEFEVWMGRK